MLKDHNTNMVLLSGVVVKIPEIIQLSNSKDKLIFEIMVSRSYLFKDNNLKKSQKMIFAIEAFGGLIKWCQRLRENDNILIQGRFQLSTKNVPVITARSIYIIKDAYIEWTS